MFPQDGLFVGELGKANMPLASRFMTVPTTVAVEPGNIGYETGLELDEGEEILGCSLNGTILVTKNENRVRLYFFVFVPTIGQLLYAGKDYWGWAYESAGISVPNELIARGIDWVMTNWFLYLMPDANAYDYRQVNLGLPSSYISRKPFILHTPHRNRAFAKGIPGGGYDLFTGVLSDGIIPFSDSSSIPTNAHKMQGHGGDMLCDWPQTVARVGEYVITDGFVIDLAQPDSANDYNSLTTYHAYYSCQRPLTPLEFHEGRTPDEGGTPVYAPDVRVASAKGKLYARGLLTMGEACLIPAAFGEAGYATEYFLYIANSHGYQGPYSPFSNTVLQEDVVWENTQPILLKDVNDPEQSFLAGLVTALGSPTYRSICALPTREGILLPNGERHGIGQDVFYDPTSRTGLMLDDVGAFFFAGDMANNTIAALDDYRCATMADWLAPARVVESISQKHVISSIHKGTLFTNIERDFARNYLRGSELGLSWGAFDLKQDAEDPDKVTGRVRVSLGLLGRKVVAINVNAPDDVKSDPFENVPLENGLKNPFNFRVLNSLESSDWQDVLDGCVLFKEDPETGEQTYGMVDPETGEITSSSSIGATPQGWETGGQNAVFGLKPNGVVYPFPSCGNMMHYTSTDHSGQGQSRFWLTFGSHGMTCVIESSSGTRIAWRHSAFGRIQPNSSTTGYLDYGFLRAVRGSLPEAEPNRLRVINENAPIGKVKCLGNDPVTDYLNRTKYQKVLSVWFWEGCVAIMRTDLDRSVFDFDAEMRRATGHG